MPRTRMSTFLDVFITLQYPEKKEFFRNANLIMREIIPSAVGPAIGKKCLALYSNVEYVRDI